MSSDARFTTDDLAKLNDLWTDFQNRKPKDTKDEKLVEIGPTTTVTGSVAEDKDVVETSGIGTQAPSHSVA